MLYTQKQINAAESRAPRLLLRALAGTGKTETVALRISTLINEGVNESDILCLCFTNAAVGQLKNRLESKGHTEVKVSTIDSYAFSLLQNWMDESGQRVQVSTGEEIVSKLLMSYGIGYSKSIVNKFLQMSNLRWFGQELSIYIPGIAGRDVDRVLTDYDNAKREAGVIDFTDLVVLASGLKKNTHYTEIIVDEAQDANMAHFKFIESISSDRITLVGDENQTIFEFNGVSSDSFAFYCRDWTVLSLVQSFRHKKEILKTLNTSLKNGMTLKSNIEGGEVYHGTNLLNIISKVIQQDGSKCFIGRTRYDLLPLIGVLKSLGITVGKSWEGEKPGDFEFFAATVHFAKGLEWDNVMVVNMNKEGFRGYESDISKNRRLSYVAASRAKSTLYLHTIDGELPFTHKGDYID